MSNDLTTFMSNAKLPALSDEQLANALTEAVDDAGGVSQAGMNFLDFSGKTGMYKYGRDKEDIDEDMLFVMEPSVTCRGWVCWKESKAVAKHKWLATDKMLHPERVVSEDELEDHGPYRANSGDGWKEMMGIGVLPLDDLSTSVEFTSTAVSAINGLKDLVQASADRVRGGEPSIPIISFGREQFTAQGSTNWKPTFNVEAWVAREAVAAFAEGDLSEDDLLAGEAPKKKRSRKK